MSLEQAIQEFYDVVKGAMTADDFLAALWNKSGQLFTSGRVIILFAYDLATGKREVADSIGTDAAGRKLYSLLADATDAPQAALNPAEALGPMAWIAIARMIFEILTRLKGRNK